FCLRSWVILNVYVMKKFKGILTSIGRWVRKHKKRLIPATNILAFIALGLLLLVLTKAATPFESIEAERGTLQGMATTTAVSGASNGQAVRFNAMSMNNDLGNFLYNTTLNSRWNQYKDSSESEVNANIANRGNYSSNPAGYQAHNSQGQFRFYCQYSHFNYDDPILYPGQPGKAHLHMYWGNGNVTGNTNVNSLVNSGGSTCQGYEVNRTGYWMPAMLDGNNKAVIPETILMYYKTALNNAAQTKVKPQGLKMIAGYANGDNNSKGLTHVNGVAWVCYTGSLNYTYIGTTIPDNCPANTRENAWDPYNKVKDPSKYNSQDTFPVKLQAIIFFPACVKVDGAGKPVLDSADHYSHVTYYSGSGCPSTHPYMMPQVSYHVMWPGNLDYSKWKLSSDAMAGVADGASLHADWYGGWTIPAMEHWIKGCINTQQNCSNGVMAPGGGYPHRQLQTIPTNYTGPNFLTIPTKR
ncbi:DUF1996 domain-containing protein, partial [Candidatus Saccharibacteria bacterium]|nr:DUF1996 domain-containing protein [Candidatus Saccharibacteria bacterium]